MSYTTLSQTPGALGDDALREARGWDVRTAAGERLGRVGDVILEDGARARYLDVEAGGFFNPKRVLLPAAHAQIDAERRMVRLRDLTREQFKNLPEYSGRPEDIGWLLESLIERACTSRADGHAGWAADGEGHADERREDAAHARSSADAPADAHGSETSPASHRSHADDKIPVRALERLHEVRTRPEPPASQPMVGESARAAMAASGLGVQKSVDTQHVRIPVTRMREEIVVERRPVEGISADDARPIVTDDEIRIPLVEEEIVVQRRAVVREEIVIRKRAIAETTEVEADVRRERVDFGAAATSTPASGDASELPLH